jgi:hypothetical protein
MSVSLKWRTYSAADHVAVFPLIYHDIPAEIPEASRPLITRIFQLWLVLALTLVINMVACIFILISGSKDGGADVGASVMYVSTLRVWLLRLRQYTGMYRSLAPCPSCFGIGASVLNKPHTVLIL